MKRLIVAALVLALCACKVAEPGPGEVKVGDTQLVCTTPNGQVTFTSRWSDYIHSDDRNAEIWYIRGQGQYHQDFAEVCGVHRAR